jgi:hypothetical protein
MKSFPTGSMPPKRATPPGTKMLKLRIDRLPVFLSAVGERKHDVHRYLTFPVVAFHELPFLPRQPAYVMIRVEKLGGLLGVPQGSKKKKSE